MGKVKVKIIGDENLEEAQIAEGKVKREQKNLREGKTHVAGMKGGERTVTVGVTEEEIAASLDQAADQDQNASTADKSGDKSKKTSKKKKHVASLRHKLNKATATRDAITVSRAIEKLKSFKPITFDETVELHVNTREKGISGLVTLPYGTGKTLKIKVVDDALISEIEQGKINFDMLVAQPSMMPKLARVAKILGPRGLMPNPKNGTISENTEEAVKKLSAGQINFKTESAAPIIHLTVGKLSFEDKKLADNITTALTAIGAAKISNVTLKSTMSPAVRLTFSSAK